MDNEELEELAAEAKRLYEEEDRLSFPYDGCRTLLGGNEDEFEGFIPNLDLYFMDIAGYCSSGTRILKWSEQKIREAQRNITLAFFEQHPQYKVLQRYISDSSTPDLYEDLMLYEKMRHKLLELFSGLLDNKKCGAQGG